MIVKLNINASVAICFVIILRLLCAQPVVAAHINQVKKQTFHSHLQSSRRNALNIVAEKSKPYCNLFDALEEQQEEQNFERVFILLNCLLSLSAFFAFAPLFTIQKASNFQLQLITKKFLRHAVLRI